LTSGATTTFSSDYTPVSDLPEGAHTLYVQERDAAGNWSSSGSFTIIIDTTPPNIPSIPDMTSVTDTGLSNTNNITNDTTPVFTGSAEAGSTVTLSSSVSGTIGTATADAGGGWSITSAPLSEGSQTITAAATDAAGNQSSASGGLTVTIDTSTPSASVAVSANPTAGGTVTGGNTYSEGAAIIVTATPNSSYTFVNWTEGGIQASTSVAYSFTFGTSDRTLTANFAAIPSYYTVGIGNLTGGNITASPTSATSGAAPVPTQQMNADGTVSPV